MRSTLAGLSLFSVAAVACVPTPAGPVSAPAVAPLALDMAIRDAQGERASREWDVWDLVQGADIEPGGIDDLIKEASAACPAARGRLTKRDSGTLVLRRWGSVANTAEMERQVEAWLASRRAAKAAADAAVTPRLSK